MSTTRQELLAHFDGLLQPERFKDYGPNGPFPHRRLSPQRA